MSKFVPDPAHAEKSAGRGGGHSLVWRDAVSCCVPCVQGALHPVAQLVGLGAMLVLVSAGHLQGCQAQGWGRTAPSLAGRLHATLLSLSQPQPPHPASELRDAAEVTWQQSRGIHLGQPGFSRSSVPCACLLNPVQIIVRHCFAKRMNYSLVMVEG